MTYTAAIIDEDRRPIQSTISTHPTAVDARICARRLASRAYIDAHSLDVDRPLRAVVCRDDGVDVYAVPVQPARRRRSKETHA